MTSHPAKNAAPAVIHATAHVHETATIGAGTSIWHEAQVRERAVIGEECILGKSAYVDRDVHVGNRVKIQNRASLYHGVTIEDGVFIGPHVVFANDRMPRAINPDGTLKGEDDWTASPTTVHYGASIGAGSVILPGLRIGRYALVGAGSTVTHDVHDHALVAGNPARLMGYVCVCANRLIDSGEDPANHHWSCPACDRSFRVSGSGLVEA